MEKRPHILNRRRVFRLRLPLDCRLKATIGGQPFQVIEVSEFSFVVTQNDVGLADHGACSGTIVWNDNRSSEFTGAVGRVASHGRVIWNVEGILMSDIVSEQRRLVTRYGVGALRKAS